MSRDQLPISRYVQPELKDARLQRQLEAVASAVPRRRLWRRARVPGVAVAATAVVIAAVSLVLRGSHAEEPQLSGLIEGTRLESRAGSTLQLPDHTVLSFTAPTLVEVETWRDDSARLLLEYGTVELKVAPVKKRLLTLVVGDVEVRVRGTRFTVARAPSSISVSVAEGVVEVARRELTRTLTAGQSWEIELEAEVGSAPLPAGLEPSEPEPEPTTPEPQVAPHVDREREKKLSRLIAARELRQAYALLGPRGFAEALESAPPRRLLELAEIARFNNRPAEAAAAFDRLRRRHPRDARAPLAAFELGRLRLDRLSDPKGALEALDDALRLAPAAPFREDLDARRVQALDALGRLADCRAAKAQYLATYPSGVHAATLRSRCPPE